MNHLFKILLVLSITVCPLRCQSGSCCSSKLAESVDQDCGCCSENESEQDSCPTPARECQNCQCWCSGAIVPDLFAFEDSIEWQSLFNQLNPVAELTQKSFCMGQRNLPPDNWQLDSNSNIGRTMRHLHCSLIL